MPMPMIAMGCNVAVDGVVIVSYELQLDTASQIAYGTWVPSQEAIDLMWQLCEGRVL